MHIHIHRKLIYYIFRNLTKLIKPGWSAFFFLQFCSHFQFGLKYLGVVRRSLTWLLIKFAVGPGWYGIKNT